MARYILKKAGLEEQVSDKPQLYLAATDFWTNVIVRYLVHARERRKWKTELLVRVNAELNRPEHTGKDCNRLFKTAGTDIK